MREGRLVGVRFSGIAIKPNFDAFLLKSGFFTGFRSIYFAYQRSLE